MYQSKYIFKDDLTIEIIKHNKHIIIKDNNYNKDTFIGYSIKQAIKQFKKQYKQKGNKMTLTQFLWECTNRTLLPSIVIENDEIKKALTKKDDNKVLELLNELF